MSIDPCSLSRQRCCSVIGKVSRRLRPKARCSVIFDLMLRISPTAHCSPTSPTAHGRHACREQMRLARHRGLPAQTFATGAA
jgi:hypothetical protein